MYNSKIIDILDISRTEWLDTCRHCNYATFFHTPLWAELFQKWSGGKSFPYGKKIIFDDRKSAVVPLVQKTRGWGLLKINLSMPAGTYGGIVSKDTLNDSHIRSVVNFLYSYKNIQFRENPFNPIPVSVKLEDAVDDFTQVLNLSDGYEMIWKRADRCHHKAVRKAQNAGVKIREADSFDDWKSFSELYACSIGRWKNRGNFNGVQYSIDHYSEIYKLDNQYKKLFLATFEREVIAGLLCFYWNKHAVAWHGAGKEDYFHLRPNNLLYDYAISDACGSGYQWFDCNPSKGIKGVEDFKEYLGTVKIQSRIVNRMSFFCNAAISIRGKLKL